jgi:hypothetical protein
MTPGPPPSGGPPPWNSPRRPRDDTGQPRFAEGPAATARVLHWGLLVGGLVSIADLATLAMQQQWGSGAEVGGLDAFNVIVNCVLFFVAGAAVVRETGRVRFAALAGLLAGLVDGMVVGAATAMAPPPNLPRDTPSHQVWLALVLQNAALGTLLAAAIAWFSRLTRRGAGN